MNHQGSQQESQGKRHGRWNPDAVCDGIPARDRAQWLVHNEGLSHEAARQQLMSEYPRAFSECGHHHPDGNGQPLLDLEQHFQNDSFGHVLEALLKIPGVTYLGSNKVVFPERYRTWQRIHFEPDSWGHLLERMKKDAGAVHLGGSHVLVPGDYVEMKFEPDSWGHVLEALHKEVSAVHLGGSRILVPSQVALRKRMKFEPDSFGHVLEDLRKASFTWLGGAQVLMPAKYGTVGGSPLSETHLDTTWKT